MGSDMTPWRDGGPFDILWVDQYAPSMITGVDKKPWTEADLEALPDDGYVCLRSGIGIEP
jgi:hypothetical protein